LWKVESVIVLLVLMLIGLCGGLLVMLTFGSHIADALGVDTLFVQHLVSFSCLHGLALIWIYLFLRSHQTTAVHGFGLANYPLQSIALGLGSAIIALPIAMFGIGGSVAYLMKLVGLEPQAQPTVTVIREHGSSGQTIALGVAALVLAPVVEEVIFRGVLYQTVKQRGYPRLALWGTAVLFAGIHFNVAALLPLLFLALVFTWLYDRTQNLLAPIVAHALFNGVNFLALANPWKWKWLDRFLEQ
jgi:uncharacterized protein